MSAKTPSGYALSRHADKRSFLISLAGVVVVGVVLNLLDQHLRTSVAPYGIVSFELAGDWQSSWVLLSSWDHTARLHAALMLGLDYLFLLLYPWCLYCACRGTAGAFGAQSLWQDAGRVVAVMVWFAAPLDAVENYALWQMLNEAAGDIWPRLALICAIPKFALVGVALVYIVLGQVVRVLRAGH